MTATSDRITDHLTRERLALEARRARKPLLWVLLLLAGAGVAFVLLLEELHLPAPWQHQYTLRIAAPNITGVQTNDEVRIAGVQVGHITAINLVHGTAVMTTSIDPQYAPVYRNAQVQVRPNTPLEDMFVDIVSRGTRTAGQVKSGGEIPASQVQSPVQIGQVIDIFDSAVRPRVTAAINALGQGLGDHGEQLKEALVDLAPFLQEAKNFSQTIADRTTETEQLVHNFALLGAEVAGRSRQLTGLVDDGATTMHSVASVERQLGATIDELPPTLTELPSAMSSLDQAADQVTPAARALIPVADALAPALRSLKTLSPIATTALAALDRPLPSLTSLLKQAKPVATGLARAFARLRPQTPELNYVTAEIIKCSQPLQDFFQWTMSVSKLSGPDGNYQRGLGIFGAQSLTDLADQNINPEKNLAHIAPTCVPAGVPAT